MSQKTPFFLFETPFSLVCSCSIVLPEIPALPQAIVESTHPESRPQAAWQPPLQHQSCSNNLYNIIVAVTVTQYNALGHDDEVYLCIYPPLNSFFLKSICVCYLSSPELVSLLGHPPIIPHPPPLFFFICRSSTLIS